MMIAIYKITNPLGKIYIGQTKNYTQRLYNYSNPNSNQIGRKLYNSIKKYSWEHHIIEIIQILENSLNVQEMLDDLEIYYIKIFNSVKKGLNLTYGGNGGKPSPETINKRIESKTNKILQYDLQNNFIKEWRGLIEIETILGYKRETIRMNINGKTQSTHGYKWFYKDKLPKVFKSKVRKINQYDLEGNFIKEWDNVKEAKIWLGVGDIYSCLIGKQKTSNNYIWKYVEL
jgi:group I intron endonuclease